MGSTISRAAATGIDYPFFLPDGGTLVLPDLDIALVHDDERLARFTLEVSVPLDVYQRIDTDRLFHLEPEARGTFHEGTFEPGKAVELELELASPVVAELAAAGISDAPNAIGYLMRVAEDAHADEPLLNPRRWYATRVKQRRSSGIATGFSTTWARAAALP